MIISVSGKIGSGKDTVGDIVKYLTMDSTVRKEWLENLDERLRSGPIVPKPMARRMTTETPTTTIFHSELPRPFGSLIFPLS